MSRRLGITYSEQMTLCTPEEIKDPAHYHISEINLFIITKMIT